MKRLLALVLFLAFSSAVQYDGEGKNGQCENKKSLDPRPHSVSLLEFGAVGDGKTLNTLGLTGSFNLTSHLTLFLEAGAIILGSQDYAHWDIVKPLPSYGRGIDLPGWRYRSLINGHNLSDVVITGDNGTIDGQGSVWWEQFNSHALNYSRPHLVEFTGCDNVTISNLTLLNSPAWNIHPAYCRYVQVLNITVHASPASPYTSGIVPDSSENVCIENCNISMGHDAIVLKSGWDEYGIAYGKPTKNVHIRSVNLQSSLGAGLAFGSEMSGGISNILVEQLHLRNSFIGIALKTTRGRGGYMKDIIISNVEMENIHLAMEATGQSGSHPDEKFDPDELPFVKGVTFENMVGTNITLAGNFSGLDKLPFTSICLSNISFSVTWNSSTSWFCSNVMGFSKEVSPKPCSNLRDSTFNSSAACFFSLYPFNYATVF
ncbi:putative polygalacturonase isoform X1 [Prunus yedoensis var. nudiflora]|uniref:Putative polygalacturonase isoform X1 n=1 Tax=Prunus yedoensis var. nudiflora TaxID=2094558 RepID=A0A314YZP0_PRUYE|nr:putative polygalacturonase isoform X1 [Prunus yedoensis var. nudiflora]